MSFSIIDMFSVVIVVIVFMLFVLVILFMVVILFYVFYRERKFCVLFVILVLNFCVFGFLLGVVFGFC